MTKNKYLGIAAGCLGLVLVSGLAYWILRTHVNNGHIGQKLDNLQSATVSSGGAVSQNSIALNQAGQAPSDNSGLSVSPSNPASSLGQLGGNQKSAAGSSPSAGTEASGAPTAQTFNPTTFSQYDKYKASTGALFGEAPVGTGAELTANHKAAVYYRGWLTNGQLFDQSRPGSDGKLQPFVFTEGAHQVIPGWEEGLAGMKVGGVRLLIVPPAVGYGTAGQGSIPPNAVLVFQVQLLEVQ